MSTLANGFRTASMACLGLAAGGLMAAGLATTGGNGHSASADSVTVAVALPQTPDDAPTLTPTPSYKAPPLPNRAPRVAPVDVASDELTSEKKSFEQAAERIVTAKPAAVRAGPSEDAAMLFGFPARRALREIGRDGDFVHVADVESGAQGWIEQDALASSLMTASIAPKPEPVRAKRIKQASAEIDTPKPVTGIPAKKYRPMLLGGGNDRRARKSSSKTNFAGFLARAFR